MATSPPHLPFNVEEVYGQNPVRAEGMLLANESSDRIANQTARVRLLTDFIFVKAGKFVFPDYELCTKEFWKGVHVWGFMMSPTGRCRWLAWSLLWHLDWPEKHMELVKITRIDGMSKESHKLYRNGNQTALWVNSSQGNAYALMEPDERIAQRWVAVCESWREADPDKTPIAFCGPVTVLATPPVWWHERGKRAGARAWQQLVAQQTKHLEQQEGGEGGESKEDDTLPTEQRTAAKGGKTKEQTATKRERGSAKETSRGASARKRAGTPQRVEKQAVSPRASTSKSKASPTKRPDNQPAASSEPASSLEGLLLRSEDDPDPPPAERLATNAGREPSPKSSLPSGTDDSDASASDARPSKRIRITKSLQLAVPIPHVDSILSGRQVAKDRLQREAGDSYIPGPSTQAANALPALSPDGGSPRIVFAKDTSPPFENDPPSQTQAASQGSQLAQQVTGLSMGADGSKKAVEGVAEGIRAAVEPDGAAAVQVDVALSGVVASSAPGAAELANPDMTQSTSSSSSVPDAAPAPAGPASEIEVQSPPPTHTVPAIVIATPPQQGPLPPTGPAATVGTPAAPVVECETGHRIAAVPGLDKSSVLALDERSSRRHRRGPA